MATPTNQFLNGTRGSNYASNTFFRDAMSRLTVMAPTHATIQIMHDRTEPVYKQWDMAYTEWLARKGDYAGQTDKWEEVANELSSTKYQVWRSSLITAGIMPDSGTFTTLMPNGAKYYHGGRYERRTAEVKTFSEQLDKLSESNFTAFQWTVLSALKADVSSFYIHMTQTRNAQQETEKNNDDAPITLENARTALCVMLHRNMGLLIDLYPTQPEVVDSFYDWSQLRNKNKKKNETNNFKDDDMYNTNDEL